MTGTKRNHMHKGTHAHKAPHAAAAARRPHRAAPAAVWKGCRYAAGGVGAFFAHPWVCRPLLGIGALAVVIVLSCLGLWLRLSSGPIAFDVATPWLKAAIEENFGNQHTVAVGGTQIERDEVGRPSIRIRDIVVRDADGTIVASAPKAEVGMSAVSLLSGHLRAQSLNLVGAEMSIRIESDGRVTVFAGADKRPIATAQAPIRPTPAPATPDAPAQDPLKAGFENFAGVLAWIDSVGASGLDGHDLREVGLKNGNLTVDDQRNGKRWTFDHINVSVTRPHQGGVVFKLESENPKRPWVLSAAMRPLSDGIRAIGIEARKVSTRDMMLAMRLNESIEADLPVSASIRADVAADGTPQMVQGQLSVDAGTIIDHKAKDPTSAEFAIDRADFRFNWDARRRSLIVPFQIQSGGNQFTLRASFDAPADKSTAWVMTLTRGDSVIDPVILGAASNGSDQDGIALNRAILRARIDTVKRRIDLDQGDFRRIDTRPSQNVGVAVTGSLDYSGPEPRLAFGVAATRMPLAAMKRLWPFFVNPDVRKWVDEHFSAGTVERIVIAGNALLPTFNADGPPMPEEGVSIDIETSATTLQPVPDLPAIRDADLTVHITGANATVSLGRGTVEVAGGRKLNVAGGVFQIPNTHLKPQPASATFRIDGSVPAAAALLASDALNDTVGIALDPTASRGTVAAQVTVNFLLGKNAPPNNATYAVAADLTNFAADKMLLGQRVEAAALKVNATSDGYQIKGDVKVNGTPASVEVIKQKGDQDAELHVAASLDDAARKRLGIDLGGSVTGSIPVKATSRFGSKVNDDRMSVDADLTPVKIDNLLPGWVKPAGKPARVTYTLSKTPKSMRFDDLTIDGSGASVKGSVELDGSSDLVSANFPVFGLSDGDKVTLKVDRGNDGAMRVMMRGDVYDGRNFVKSAMAGSSDKTPEKQTDLDLDIKIGAVAGHNGETLRGLDLKLSRRNGRIRSFNMSAKIGRDTPLMGDLRLRARDNHQVVYLETDDSGALFRFTDMYPRMYGGQMWVAMDPPTQDHAPQIGTLFIRNFVVRGEPALDRVVAGAPGVGGQGSSVDFSEMRADFTRFPGKMAVRDGVVRGPLVGATVEGQVDYVRDEVHLRGTFVPFYGLNNMFGQIPIVGLFLGGGSNEGLLGITYEAVGPPSAPRISVNPVTAIAPGLLRKFIPSPGSFDRNFIPPTR